MRFNAYFNITNAFPVVMLTVLLVACGNKDDSEDPVNDTSIDQWTWISGSDSVTQPTVYGTKGAAASTNMIGSRQGSATWTDTNDNLWLFGGIGYDRNGVFGYFNGLWKFDGTNWTWVSGSSNRDQWGSYGTKGLASASNVPGARRGAASWIDSNNHLWLFGGDGFDSAGNLGYLNDLWKYDGANWTWVGGSNTRNQKGLYGTKGVATSSIIPGARYGSVSWIDSSNNLWLFGGYGYDSVSSLSLNNDLWKFDGTNWTWISGSNVVKQPGTYGTLNITAATNMPGARLFSVSWIDNNNNMWLFGGRGYDSAGSSSELNDLWKFDGANWTWVSGSKIRDASGIYGTKGATNATNIPGARSSATSWIDNDDIIWLFGGNGKDNAGTLGGLNDMWKFDGTNWTWVSGTNVVYQAGVYGTKGVAADTNLPGSREFANSWIDSESNLWLFGGKGYDSSGTFYGYLNDLWRYQP